MKLNPVSVKTICGDSNEVVVYGFGAFKYLDVCRAINNDISGITALNSDDYIYKNQVEDSRQASNMFSHFKFIINDLVLENVKKQKNGEPIIPLLFIVGLDNQKCDVNRVLEREDHFDKGVTLTELRRCYKIAHEFGDDLTDIALKTFKFVELHDSSNGYELRVVQPFWTEKNWKQGWDERKKSTEKAHSSQHKNNFWREQYKKLISDENTKTEAADDESTPNKI